MMLHQLLASHAFLACIMPESAAEQQYHAVVCLQIRLQAALPGTYKWNMQTNHTAGSCFIACSTLVLTDSAAASKIVQ